MMHLKKDFFLEKMLNIDSSQDSLKALALYFKIYEDDYKTILEGFEYVYRKSSINYRLVMCLLIDKIIDLNIDSKIKEEFRVFVDFHLKEDLPLYEDDIYFVGKVDELIDLWHCKGYDIT